MYCFTLFRSNLFFGVLKKIVKPYPQCLRPPHDTLVESYQSYELATQLGNTALGESCISLGSQKQHSTVCDSQARALKAFHNCHAFSRRWRSLVTCLV